ncbi:hypothetical protein HispidOSU_010585 [Sigmodon hispidus]
MTRKQKQSKEQASPPLPGSPSCQETGQTHEARPEDNSSDRKSRPHTSRKLSLRHASFLQAKRTAR